MAEAKTEWESLGGNNIDGIGGNAKKVTYTAEDGTKKSLQIDCGMKFSIKEDTGYDSFIAPLDCTDLLLTHAHADHIAGIVHHIQMHPEKPLNIIASPFTHKFLESELMKQGLPLRYMPNFQDVNDGDVVDVNGFKVEVFGVTHSAPGSVGFLVESPDGTHLMDMGDFKTTPALLGTGWEDKRIAEIFAKGVDVCFCDSTSTTSSEVTPSYAAVTEGFKKILKDNPHSQLVVATIARSAQQMTADVIAVAEYAKETGTKPKTFILDGSSLIAVDKALRDSGISMEETVEKLTGVRVKIVDAKSAEAKNTPASERIYMVTGTQGEEKASLAKLAMGTNRNVHPAMDCPNLCVIQQAVIPAKGNQEAVDGVVQGLKAQGFDVMLPERGAPFEQGVTYYVSGHGRAGDMAVLAKLARENSPADRPCTFIGQHGDEVQTQATENIFKAEGLTVAHMTNAQKVSVSKGKVAVSSTIGKATRIAVNDKNNNFMAPDYEYVKQVFNPMSKQWEDTKTVEYTPVLQTGRGKGGKKGGKKGGRRELNPALVAKLQKTH